MCHVFSCIISKEGETTWKMGIDSHDKLIKIAGFEDNTKDPEKIQFCRIEISPENLDYLDPDAKYHLKVDMDLTPKWWSEDHERQCWLVFQRWKRELDQILVRKPIIHPFRDIVPPGKIDPKILKHLIELASVGESVRDSVWDSVWASVGDSVRDSVWDSVRASVRASVRESVRASVRDSVWASVRDSVRASVWDSVWASVYCYIGSFFILPREAWQYTKNIQTSGYPFESFVKLWELGLVPSFDGKIWRLNGGPNATILWQGTIEDAIKAVK